MTDAEQAVLSIARDVLAGRVHVLEGCRALRFRLAEADLDDAPGALTIIGVESETDDLPLGRVRELWSPEALRAQDVEIERCVALYRANVEEACRELVAHLERKRDA